MSETERIREVYGRYDDEDRASTHWDPAAPGNREILAERDLLLAEALNQVPSTTRVLELGCGSGEVLAAMASSGLQSTGIDLLGERVERARSRLPDSRLLVGSGTDLPFADDGFGIVTCFTVFSSIPDGALRNAIVGEVARVLQPGGALIWYDMRRANPRNPAVSPLDRAQLERLFPGWTLDLQPVTVLPPLVRRMGRFSQPAYLTLGRLNGLKTHLFGTISP